MRKILILLIFVLIGCTSYKYEVYAYVIPFKAEKALHEKIKDFDNVFLELDFTEKGYSFFVIPTKDINHKYFGYLKVKNSNRKLLVNSKFYYLVFSSDVTLGSKINLNKIQTIAEKESMASKKKDDELIVYKKNPIYDRAILINFDKDWNVIVENKK